MKARAPLAELKAAVACKRATHGAPLKTPGKKHSVVIGGAGRRGRPDMGRRQLIISAAAELSFRIGLGALTHRAVAEEANVPLGSTTYYFASISDIQLEVVSHVTNARTAEFVRDIGAIPQDQILEVAKCLVRILVPHGQEPLAAYRWFIEAARIDVVRPIIASWNNLNIGALARHFSIERAVAEDIVALADGLFLNVVLHGWFKTDIADRLASGIRRLLD
jgi:TetR/AcrR family transcriptional regulator, regulator of biofilm formation and stress response